MSLDKFTSNDQNFNINNKSTFAQILIFFGTTALCFSVFAGIGQLLLAKSIGAENVNEFLKHPLQNLQFVNAFKWMQLLSSIGMFGLSALLFSFLKNKNGFQYLLINKLPNFNLVAMVIPIVVFSLPIIAITYFYNQQIHFGALDKLLRELELQNGEITKAMLSSTTIAGLLFNILVVAIVPGIVEELFFRGILQNLIHESLKNKHVAIWFTAIVFSAVHMEFLGFFPRVMMGAMLGYLYMWSGNIWINIFAHALNNGISVIAFYLYHNQFIKTDIDKMENYGVVPTIAAILLFAASYYFFYKKTEQLQLATKL